MHTTTIPKLVRKAYKSCIWQIPNNENKVFLTFDDGPTPDVTEKVLEMLQEHDAKATFFCVGNNAATHPLLLKSILNEGHALGNHTFDHLDGWKTPTDIYLENVTETQEKIKSNLMRPPYGHVKPQQIKRLKEDYHIIMWSILTGDYDKRLSPADCLKNVKKHIAPGSIIVCHDSHKAAPNMLKILPEILKMDFSFEKIVL